MKLLLSCCRGRSARFCLWAGLALWLGFVSAVRADLVWTPDGGWKFEGGVLGPLLGNMGTAKSALQAMNTAKSAQESGRFWTALSQYDQVISDYPGSVFAPEALFQEGLIYSQRNQFEASFDCFDRIIKRYPDYPNFNGVIRQQFNVADLMATKRPYLWGWMPWFKDPEKSYDYYEAVVKGAPASEYAPMALMKIALLALEHSTFIDRADSAAQAVNALKRLINDYPQSMLASDAYLELAQIYTSLVVGPNYDQGSTRQAIRYLQDYLFYYKESSGAADAEKKRDNLLDVYSRSQLQLGDFYYYYRNSNRAALIFYNQAITLASNSPAANEARAQIDKINRGVLPPMTPYDMVFGRYNDHALSPTTGNQWSWLNWLSWFGVYKTPQIGDPEQGRIEKLAAEAFQARTAEDFLETPGAEAVETISGKGQTQEFQGFEPFLNSPGQPTPSGGPPTN